MSCLSLDHAAFTASDFHMHCHLFCAPRSLSLLCRAIFFVKLLSGKVLSFCALLCYLCAPLESWSASLRYSQCSESVCHLHLWRRQAMLCC